MGPGRATARFFPPHPRRLVAGAGATIPQIPAVVGFALPPAPRARQSEDVKLRQYLYLLPLGAWVGCLVLDYAGAL